MAKSTAPVLIIGGITIATTWIGMSKDNRVNPDFQSQFFLSSEFWRPAVATGIMAGAFALLEKVNQPLTVGIAWVALVTTLFVPIPNMFGTGNKESIFELLNDLQAHPEKYM